MLDYSEVSRVAKCRVTLRDKPEQVLELTGQAIDWASILEPEIENDAVLVTDDSHLNLGCLKLVHERAASTSRVFAFMPSSADFEMRLNFERQMSVEGESVSFVGALSLERCFAVGVCATELVVDRWRDRVRGQMKRAVAISPAQLWLFERNHL